MTMLIVTTMPTAKSSHKLYKLSLFILWCFLLSYGALQAQTYRVERFQDGRPLRQGKISPLVQDGHIMVLAIP